MRLTARGTGLLVAGVLLLGLGFGFGYPELAALGCGALVAVVGALSFVAWRPQLTIDRVIDPDRVMRGDPSQVRLTITNASRFFGASLVARDRLHPRGVVPVPLVRLRPGKVTSVSYAVPTTRRGVIDLGPLEISRRDPLSLMGVVRRYGEAGTVWVHPKVHPIAAVPVGLSRSMDGRVDKVPHGSITFAALREYVVGDDLRQIHWRTSARVGELMVREHVDTSLPRVVLLVDDRAAAHAADAHGESTFEAVCEAAASVLVAAAREGIHVELQTVGGVAAAGSQAELGRMLDLLAEADLISETSGSGPSGPGAQASPGTKKPAGPASAAPENGAPPVPTLPMAVERLRVRRMGDTLIYLTGPPREEDLGVVASLRGAYPSIIAGVFGRVEFGLATTAGLLVVGAADGADFAAAWDGVRAW